VDKRSLSGAWAYHGHTAAPSLGFKPAATHFFSTHVRTRIAVAWSIALGKRRSYSRQMLRSLSPREIRDFCPDLMRAERESKKRFWRA
jgi:hypothetical protein